MFKEGQFMAEQDKIRNEEQTLNEGAAAPEQDEQFTTVVHNGELKDVQGIPPEKYEELKEKYHPLFGIYLNGKLILYRQMNIDDYNAYQNETMLAQEELQKKYQADLESGKMSQEKFSYMVSTLWDESLVKTFTVYPENILDMVKKGELPGGTLYTVAQGILSNSGFVELEPVFLNEKILEQDPELLSTLQEDVLSSFDDINQTHIQEMIATYSEIALFLFYNKLYIVRGFKYEEYTEIKELTAKLPITVLNMELTRKFLLYPTSPLSEIPAGLIMQAIPEAILVLSGFSNTTQPDVVIMD